MSAILDALGYVGDVLDRPGAAVRGVLAGRPDQLAWLVPGIDILGKTGLVDTQSLQENRIGGRDLLRQYGLAGDEDNWGNFAAGMAVDTLTNPLSLFGGEIAQGVGSAAKSAGSAMMGAGKGLLSKTPMARVAGTQTNQPSSLLNMLGKRRQFDLMEVDPHTHQINRVFGNAATPRNRNKVASDLINLSKDGVEGLYDSTRDAAGFLVGSGPVTKRHEMVHGLIDQAIKSGDTSGLPLIAKPAVWTAPTVDGGPQTLRTALSTFFDELAAQTLENRGLWNQAKGAANFLFENPFSKDSIKTHAKYAQFFDEISPMFGNSYRAIGVAPQVAAGLGVGAAGGYGLHKLNQSMSGQ